MEPAETETGREIRLAVDRAQKILDQEFQALGAGAWPHAMTVS